MTALPTAHPEQDAVTSPPPPAVSPSVGLRQRPRPGVRGRSSWLLRSSPMGRGSKSIRRWRKDRKRRKAEREKRKLAAADQRHGSGADNPVSHGCWAADHLRPTMVCPSAASTHPRRMPRPAAGADPSTRPGSITSSGLALADITVADCHLHAIDVHVCRWSRRSFRR